DEGRRQGRRGGEPGLRVLANGRPVELADGASLADLVSSLGWAGRSVVAEHNGEPVPASVMPATRLAEGDRVELVRAVAGG
ncbi:MAG: sulfur carrier protein ThiS, partial [Acidimicrobiales bacterium]